MPKPGVSTAVVQLTIAFPKHFALLSPDEIYESASAELILNLREDHRIERKPPGVHGKYLASYFSMWANTPPDGGLIAVGIEDGGKLTGCKGLAVEQLNELEKSAHLFCPDARVESKRVEVLTAGQSNFALLFRVRYREEKVVRTHSGEAFIRYGDEKHKLTEPEIHELEIDKRQVDIEKELVSLTYPDDFDMDLVRRFIEGVKKVHQPLQQYQDIEVLQQRRLGTIFPQHGLRARIRP